MVENIGIDILYIYQAAKPRPQADKPSWTAEKTKPSRRSWECRADVTYECESSRVCAHVWVEGARFFWARIVYPLDLDWNRSRELDNGPFYAELLGWSEIDWIWAVSFLGKLVRVETKPSWCGPRFESIFFLTQKQRNPSSFTPFWFQRDTQQLRCRFFSLQSQFFLQRLVRQLHTILWLETPKYQHRFHGSSRSKFTRFLFQKTRFFSFRRSCYIERKINCVDAEKFEKREVWIVSEAFQTW